MKKKKATMFYLYCAKSMKVGLTAFVPLTILSEMGFELVWITYILLGLFGGVGKYGMDLLSDGKTSSTTKKLIGRIFVGCLAGFLGGMLTESAGSFAFGTAALSGYLGADGIEFFIDRFKNNKDAS